MELVAKSKAVAPLVVVGELAINTVVDATGGHPTFTGNWVLRGKALNSMGSGMTIYGYHYAWDEERGEDVYVNMIGNPIPSPDGNSATVQMDVTVYGCMKPGLHRFDAYLEYYDEKEGTFTYADFTLDLLRL